MQRFKNLTKKSGKVASAILSAAMVTSMVLGTNVVEVKAATNDAETTTDVQSKTTNAGEQLLAARNEFKAAAEKFTVTTATITSSGVTAEYGAAVHDAINDIVLSKGYDKITGISLQTATIEAPTTPAGNNSGEGKITVPFEVTASNGDKQVGKLEYTLPNIQARRDAVKAVVDAKLKEVKPTNTIDTVGIQNKLKELSDVKDEYGIPVYSDYDFAHATANTNANLQPSDDTDEGYFGADIVVTGTSYATVDPIKTTYSTTIPTTKALVTEATAEVKDYLTNEATFLDGSFTTGDGSGSTVTEAGLAIKKILKAKGYSSDVDITGSAVVTVDTLPTTDVDGAATVEFTLKSGTYAPKKPEKVSVVLKSDATKVSDALAKLKDVASKVKVTSSTTGASYVADLEKALNDNAKSVSGTAYSLTGFTYSTNENKATGKITTPFNEIYPATTVNVTFLGKDASANKDGVSKVTFEVTSGQEVDTDSYTYTENSNQTEADKAAAAVKAKLAELTITNDTTKEEIIKVVEEAVKGYDVDYEVVSFEKNNATADKEGNAKVYVKITSRKNSDVKKEAVVDETYTIAKEYKNAFAIKDGKKFYYDKDGNLLKNTFLQGTDSPDGYTYYIQNDGSVMQDRLTYHPNGKDVIYFDAEGHEVFDAFVNVKKDVQGNAVDYIGYFGTLGGAYVNQTTYGNGVGAYSKDALFYINDYGVLENKGWFQNAAGNIGYAATNGTLTTNQWGLDQFGRKVYFQADGFLAKGLITDGVKYYQLDETDGHLVGEF